MLQTIVILVFLVNLAAMIGLLAVLYHHRSPLGQWCWLVIRKIRTTCLYCNGLGCLACEYSGIAWKTVSSEDTVWVSTLKLPAADETEPYEPITPADLFDL